MREVLSRSLCALALSILSLSPAFSQRGQAPSPQPSQQQDQQKQTDEPSTTPSPTAGLAAPVDPNSYRIGPGDVLFIRVWNEQQLSGPVVVRPDGMMTLPLIDEIKAAGLTPNELKKNLLEALGKYITKPEVMVSVQNVLSKKYFITGEVNRTGQFPLVVPTTIMEALANAGGFREFANIKKIVIMRGKERLKFNYKDAVKGKNLDQNILLEDGDTIYVP